MTEPQLQRANVADVLLQIARCKRVPELVQEPIGAELPIRTLVAMPRCAPAAVQPGLVGDPLQLPFMLLVRLAVNRGEHQIIRQINHLLRFAPFALCAPSARDRTSSVILWTGWTGSSDAQNYESESRPARLESYLISNESRFAAVCIPCI